MLVVANCQRAFWHGDADFVMPKTADDLLAPDFVARVMAVLLEHPDCAMCHAAGLVFTGPGTVRTVYPAEHRLFAVGPDPIERARQVMSHYTTAPSFWGIYRRAAVDRLLAKERELGPKLAFADIAAEVGGVYPRILQEGEMDAGAWSCGMVAGLIHDIPTCKELIDRIMAEAEILIRGRLEGMLAAV